MSQNVERPKLDETHTIRIPSHLKSAAGRMSINATHQLNERLRATFAQFVVEELVRSSTEEILNNPKALATIEATLNPKQE